MLEEKFAEADYEIEHAKLKMKEAESIIVESKAKVWEQLHAKRAITMSTIELMTYHHQVALAKEQHDNDVVMAATSMRHKENLDNARMFKIMKKQETIDKLRDELRTNKSKVTSLNSEVKTVLRGAALENEAMRKEHWKEKQLLFEKKKN